MLRCAILSRSECLWERVQAVLGVPGYIFDSRSLSTPDFESLTVDFVLYPTRPSTSLPDHLDGIAEDTAPVMSSDGDNAHNIDRRPEDSAYGIRISNTLIPWHAGSIPPAPPPTRQSSFRTSFHGRLDSQNSLPVISSPLASHSKSAQVAKYPLFPTSFGNRSSRPPNVKPM